MSTYRIAIVGRNPTSDGAECALPLRTATALPPESVTRLRGDYATREDAHHAADDISVEWACEPDSPDWAPVVYDADTGRTDDDIAGRGLPLPE